MQISTPRKKVRDTNNNSIRSSPEKNEYESLLRYFKYLVTLTITAITIILSFGLYWLGSNIQTLEDNYRNKISEISLELQDVKDKASTTISETENRSKREIDGFAKDANLEISEIRDESRNIALREAGSVVTKTLTNPLISKLIKSEATDFVRDIIRSITQFEIENQLNQTLEIQKWALTFVDGNTSAWQEYNHIYHSLSPELQKTMFSFYSKMKFNYETVAYNTSRKINPENINEYFSKIPNGLSKTDLILRIKDSNNFDNLLSTTCLRLKLLNKFESKEYRCFENSPVLKIDIF